MEFGLVSIIIPTHGRYSKHIRISIDSALNQDYSPVEVIVVDDNPFGSDVSADVKQFCDSLDRVRYIKQFGSKGACAARNLGIANANGRFVGFLDDDDEWMPDKISASLPLFNERVAMVASRGWDLVMKDGQVLQQEEYIPNKPKMEVGFDDLLVADTIGTTTQAVIDRDRLIEIGGFNESFPARQDYETWLRLTKKYRIAIVDRFLFNHIHHEYDQITKNPTRALNGYKMVYAEFKREFDANPDAFVSVNEYILKSYKKCGNNRAAFATLLKILFRRPRYLGNYVVENTKNEKLKGFLNSKRRNGNNK